MPITSIGIPRVIPFASPGVQLGTAAAEGSAESTIRSDSTLVAFDTTVPTTIAYGASAATGSAAVSSRRDHVHGMAAGTSDISARASHTANQSVSNATETGLDINEELYDTDGMWSAGVSAITCKTAGKYLCCANVSFASASGGYRKLWIRHVSSGVTTTMANSEVSNTGTVYSRLFTACVIEMAVNDYIQIAVEQTSGSSLDVLSGNYYTPILSAIKIVG